MTLGEGKQKYKKLESPEKEDTWNFNGTFEMDLCHRIGFLLTKNWSEFEST